MQLDTWYDLWRVGNILVGIFCLVWLVGGLKRQRHQWNLKTRDIWYGRLMWATCQCVLSVDGIYRGLGLSVSLVFITAAGLATTKGLLHKGAWGYDPAKDVH